MLEEITFSRLQKLSLPVEQPEDLSMHGTIYAYDKAYDAVNTRNDKPLQTIDMVKYNTTTSEDPIILDVSSKVAQAGPLAFFEPDVPLARAPTSSHKRIRLPFSPPTPSCRCSCALREASTRGIS
jgi:hypothetical protein